MSYQEFVKRVLTVAGVTLAVLAIWQLRDIVMLGILSAIIAVSMTIPANRLQKFGVRRGMAIFITLISILLGMFLFVAWILPPLVTQMGTLVADFPTAFDNVRDEYLAWYATQSESTRSFLPEFDTETVNEFTAQATSIISPLLTRAGNAVVSGLTNFVIVIIIAIFFLLDPMDFIRGFITLTPPEYRQRVLNLMVDLRLTVTTWMTALTFSISITAFLVWLIIGMVLGVPNALALGAIAGIMTVIPNVGAIVPLIPITIFTLADDPAKLPLVLPAYLAIQFTESNILTPSIVRRQLNIPAALILIFQLVAATLFGFIGIILAVPMLAIIITLVRELYVYDFLGQRGKAVEIQSQPNGKFHILERETDLNTSLVTEIRRTGLMPTVRLSDLESSAKDENPQS